MAVDFNKVNPEILKVLDSLPTFYQLLDDSSFVTVMDADGIVLGFMTPPGATPIKQIGEYMEDPSGGFAEVLRTGKRKFNYLPKEVLGEAFEGYLVPIKDNGVVVGVVIYTHSATKREATLEVAVDFKSSMHEINKSVNEMIEGMQEMSSIFEAMNEQTGNIDKDVRDASDIVAKISSNANRSNILALNASIEAARSGESGKGFAVVATEMGKFANESGASSKEISGTLKLIDKDVTAIIDGIEKSGAITKQYMENINNIKEKLSYCVGLADTLEENIK